MPVDVVPFIFPAPSRRKGEKRILYACKTLKSHMLGNEYTYMRIYIHTVSR